MSAVRKLAKQVVDTKFEDLPAGVVAQAKRVVLDSLACIYGGRQSETVRILEEVTTGPTGLLDAAPATVVGGRGRTPLPAAILINGAALRYLDYNDRQHSQVKPGPGNGHNSELLPVVLGLAETDRRSGRDLITALSIGYDVATAFTDAVQGPTLERRGWNMDLRASFAVPFVVGFLRRLEPDQIVHAVGISLSRGLVLGVVDSPAEVNSMAKNLRFPLTAQLGLTASELAAHGLTGPRALEGDSGFVQTVLGGAFDDTALTELRRHRILETALKAFAACYGTHGHLTATVDIVSRYDIRPEQITALRIRTTTRGAEHTGDPGRRYPTNKETADHSSYYLAAVAAVHRKVGPQQYGPAHYADPTIRRIAGLVTIEPDPSLDHEYPSAIVEIETSDGGRYDSFARHPLGHPSNPLSDQQVEDKFRAVTDPVLDRDCQDRIIDAVRRLDQLPQVGELTRLLWSEPRRRNNHEDAPGPG